MTNDETVDWNLTINSEIYRSMKGVARSVLSRFRRSNSLHTTDLVNSALEKMLRSSDLQIKDELHLIRLCAKVMRQVAVDSTKAKFTRKRLGEKVEFKEESIPVGASELTAIKIDNALARLRVHEPLQHEIAELKIFGGLSNTDTAACLNVTEYCVKLEWEKARFWLRGAMSDVL